MPEATNHPRRLLLRQGYLLELATIAWNIVEGIVAVTAGAQAHSVALVAFGIDSFIETASAAVVGWRLRDELRGRSAEHAERVERRAARIAGALLMLLALYIVVDAIARLLGFGEHAGGSRLGMAITALSLLVMPALAYAKLRVSRALNSRALRADAYETITCTWLSVTTLSGLVLNAAFGWWWADPLAALILVPLIVREGLAAWRADTCAHEH
jgi:cation diffusion facilitator family transporter